MIFYLHDEKLYGGMYIDTIKEISSVKKYFNKSNYDILKGSFITHIDCDPVFSTKDSEKKLKQHYQDHLIQNQGVIGNNNNQEQQLLIL